MGRTVYGVDLEESPFGGLIEKLLTEEELEKLADGGAPAGPDSRPAAPDGGDDADSDDDWAVSDDTYGSSGDVDADTDAGADDASVDDAGDGGGASDADSWAPSSPPPSTAPDDGAGFGSESGYGGSTGFGAGTELGASGDEGDGGGFLSKHKWLLLKVAVGLAALATVGLVVWRYKDRLAGLVPGRGGDGADEFDSDGPGAATGEDENEDEDEDEGVPPARRRAKVDESAPETDADEGGTDEGHDARPRRPLRREPAGGVETPGQDLDLGALVGLGVLALVAALVRKYDEERTRPHDPLVDGTLGEDEDVADDEQ
ncbi:MAG: hypothetical protein V5A28_07090 [Haloarculaceae archaeon]